MAIRAPRDQRHATGITGGDEIDLTIDDPRLADAIEAVDIEELWKHRAELHKLCARIVGDPITADDMVQETYLRALRHREKLENRPSLMPWLATVARRRSLDELRSRTRSTPFEFLPETPSGPDDDPERRVPAAETVAAVKDAFSTLNDRERELLTRQIEEGLSLSELAMEENSSVDAVRSVLVRARAKLRHAIGEDAIFPAAAPLGAIGMWLRRKANAAGLRVQRAFSVAPVDRIGELVTAGVVTIALGAGSATIGSSVVASSGSGGASSDVPSVADDAPSGAALDSAGGTGGATPRTGSAGSTRPNPLEALGVPGAAAVPLLLPPDDVESPEDARFDAFSVTAGDRPSVLAAGTRRAGCLSGCTVLFRSDDLGRTWTRLAAQGISGTAIAAAPAYPLDPRIFAMGDGGLSVSRDGGATFESVLAVPAGPLALSPAFSAGDQRVFVGTGPAIVWDDASRSATPLLGLTVSQQTHFAFSSGYPSSGSLIAGGAAPGDGDFRAAVYRCGRALDEDSCVEHTVLAGATVTPRVATVPLAGAATGVFAWTGDALFRSLDDGRTFGAVSLPADIQVNALAGDGRGAVFAAVSNLTGAGTGGVMRSIDGGATWTVLGAGTRVAEGATAVAVLPSGRILASPVAFAGGGFACSDDGGTTWGSQCA